MINPYGSRSCRSPMKADTPSPAARKHSAMAAVLLLLAAAGVYCQTASFDFINFDDNDYVYENPRVLDGLSLDNLKWAFASTSPGNWHPATWISHMADVTLFGVNPGMHHLMNVLFHMVNSVLLLFMLFKMTGDLWKSLFVAALFSLHPIHVESVAWISERKDVLSTMFWFLAVLFYTDAVRKEKKVLYYSSLICFTVGLMAKPMLVTVPAVLLILDFWPLKRFPEKIWSAAAGRLLLEKIPFFIISGISSFITILVQKNEGFVRTLGELPVFVRIQNALISYVAYITKTIAPVDLAILYPHPRVFPYWRWIGALIILAAVTAFVIRRRKSDPYLLTGWAWYLTTLLPVIGIIQVGSQAMADRYSYVPIIGFFMMLAWGAPRLFQGQSGLNKTMRWIAPLIVITYAGIAWMQTSYWKDGETIFTRTVNVTKDNHVAHNNLGNAIVEKKRYEEAILHFREAIRINPGYPDAYNNLGVVLYRRGEFGRAGEFFQRAMEINPLNSSALKNLKLVETALAGIRASIASLEMEIDGAEEPGEQYYKLGSLYFQKGDPDMAAEYFHKAISAETGVVQSMIKLAAIYERKGNPQKALDCLEQAIQAYPEDQEIRYRIAALSALLNRPEESFEQLEKAFEYGFSNLSRLRMDPRFDGVEASPAYKPLRRILK